MENFSKRQVIKDLLNGKKCEHLLHIPNILTLSAAKYGYNMADIMSDPLKYTECVIGYRKKIGYDGLIGGLFAASVKEMMAGHLPNSDGAVTGNGEDTIHTEEDLEKLRSYDYKSDHFLKNIAKNINILREKEPDEPIYVIFGPPVQLALALMGDRFGYKAMVRQPEIFDKVVAKVESYLLDAVKALWDMDIDYLWEPIPSFSGLCISRKTYESRISPANQRFNERLLSYGAKIVIHTCGNFNDRFDLVAKEHAQGWHVSLVDTKTVVDQYANQVVIIGNLPCVDVILDSTPEEVYKAAYKDAMVGGASGRFILSGDCDLSPRTSDDNMFAIQKAVEDANKVLWG